MEVKLQGNEPTSNEASHEYVVKRVSKLERFYADILEADVVLTVEKTRDSQQQKG